MKNSEKNLNTIQIGDWKIFTVALFVLFLIPTKPLSAQTPDVTNPQPDLTSAVEEVSSSVGPAVVSIHTEQTEKYAVRKQFYGSPFDDEIFERFFEEFFGEMPEYERKHAGMGSGVIINDQGYILTNEHVVDGADKISVILPDGREFKGTLKGTDPRSDLAVVKIDAKNLPVAKLGESDTLKIGQWVVAIGNPFGNLMSSSEPTVTVGVVSALRRSLPQTSKRNSTYNDLIQTDAAINPGNSGGPLVNLRGEIIGINVALFSTSGGYQGVGFAIPINAAKRIINDLIEGKEVAYGWIGVSVQNVNQNLADYFGLPDTSGAVVIQTLKDGPAAKAGIKDGDIILSIDGKNIKDVTALLKVVGESAVDKTVSVNLLRDKKALTLSVKIGKRPTIGENGETIVENEEGESEKSQNQTWRGLTVQDLTPEIARRFQLEDQEGVIVTSVENASAGEDAGIRKGDIITSVNNQPIRSAADFKVITKRAQGNALIRTTRGYLVVKERRE